MTPISQWSLTIKSASIAGLLSVVVLLASAVGALSVLEPYFPVYRKQMRSEIAASRLADAAQYKAIDATLAELKLIALDGQIRDAKTTLAEIVARLLDSPGDRFLLDLKAAKEKEIAAIERLRAATACELLHMTFPTAACS